MIIGMECKYCLGDELTTQVDSTTLKHASYSHSGYKYAGHLLSVSRNAYGSRIMLRRMHADFPQLPIDLCSLQTVRPKDHDF